MSFKPFAARAALVTALFGLLSCVSTVRYSTGTDAGGVPKNSFNYLVIPRGRIMDVVNRYSGVPYQWGGENREGMDCSGFIRTVYRECERIELPHNSREMTRFGVPVPVENLESGDLVFFKINNFRVNHVGIYLGDGKFAHASWYSGVTVTDMNDAYYQGKFAYARRLYLE
ncbi:MAG: NlpC/P60 family protein [Fibrobacterota bacterium]